MNPTTLLTVMNDVLTACRAAYDIDGAPKIPTNVYLIHGTPTWFGEQLVVWSPGLLPTGPFPLPKLRAVKTTVVPAAQINIEVIRECWPTTDAGPAHANQPAPENYTDAATVSALDASTIFSQIATLAAAGTLCPSLPGVGTSEDFALSPMVPLGPLGVRFGWRLPLAVKLAVT